MPTLPFWSIVTAVEPAGAMVTLPVDEEPRVSACLLVVPSTPVAVR